VGWKKQVRIGFTSGARPSVALGAVGCPVAEPTSTTHQSGFSPIGHRSGTALPRYKCCYVAGAITGILPAVIL
jgi:hypothetical protein